MSSNDETGTLDAAKLRELAAWYREFAERAEPSVREKFPHLTPNEITLSW